MGVTLQLRNQEYRKDNQRAPRKKTTELQSLDSQPTFGDMLDKSGKVQFNLNAKQRVAAAGVNVKPSSKRKKLAFAFKSHETSINSQHPETYPAFKEQQRQTHCEGVKNGQALFQTKKNPIIA